MVAAISVVWLAAMMVVPVWPPLLAVIGAVIVAVITNDAAIMSTIMSIIASGISSPCAGDYCRQSPGVFSFLTSMQSA